MVMTNLSPLLITRHRRANLGGYHGAFHVTLERGDATLTPFSRNRRCLGQTPTKHIG